MSNGSEHPNTTILSLVSRCCEYMYGERHFTRKTILGYREAIFFFAKVMGNPKVEDLTIDHFITFKAEMGRRGAGESRTASIINGVKCLLVYCRDIRRIPVMQVETIKAPKPKRRQVLYLTTKEWQCFIDAIVLRNWDQTTRIAGYCQRALVETLIATGMRISEALSLDRHAIDKVAKTATVVGKGGKQRKVFFNDRALHWIDEYIALRNDADPALFLSLRGKRMTPDMVGSTFRRIRRRAGLSKKVSPHVLRHTAATTLLRNGCPIGFIKEILGHSDLMTTCRYYLGTMDEADTKRAHELYSGIEKPETGGTQDAQALRNVHAAFVSNPIM